MSELIDSSLAVQFDRLPPHSIQAEMELLGSLLLVGTDRVILSKVRQIVSRQSFYQIDHQIVWDAICRTFDAGKAVDALTIREALKSQQLWEECGGTEHFAAIAASAFTPVHAPTYAATVRERELWRYLIQISNEALRDGYAPHYGTMEEATAALGRFAAAASRFAAGGKAAAIVPIGKLFHEVTRDRTAEDAEEYIETGISSLDDLIGGLWIGQKTIVAGRPGAGKSTLLRQFAINIAKRGVRVGFISVEESGPKIARNALANQAGIPNSRIAKHQCSRGEIEQLKDLAEELNDLPIFVVDSVRSISSIVGIANILVAEHKCRVMIVDHLHLIDAESNRNREQEICKISAELKWCWKELKAAGVEAAQLNRGNAPQRPTLTSLRDSGSIEQDADVVALLHREDYYHYADPGYVEDNILEVNIAKNRDAPVGVVSLQYQREIHKITATDPFRAPSPNLPPEW